MTFDVVAPALFALGLAALAAALFALQRLRVRHREVPVVTTLFWKEAVADARARVFVQRFRHPFAYLLVLAIAGLIWLAVAGPRSTDAGERDWVLVLDASAGMARGERLARAAEALTGEVERLPRAATTVLACGATTRALLLPGEEPALLAARLATVAAETCPARVEAELLRLAVRPGERPLSVRVFGGAPVRAEVLDELPAHVSVARAQVDADGDRDGAAPNRGITALGAGDPRSGAWTRVDVLAEVRGAGAEAAELGATLDGEPLQIAAERTVLAPGHVRVVLRDVLASGGTLRVRVAADAFELDDEAALALPARARIRVACSAALADGLVGALLRLDPAVELVADRAGADVVVRGPGDPPAPGVPSLDFVGADEQEEAFLVTHDEGESEAALVESFARLGLDRIDATALATEVQRTIAVGARPGSVRALGVWAELVGERYNFVQSQAFPLLVAQAVRWLADVDPLVPYVAVGAPAASSEAHAAADGATLDPVGARFVPPRAGTYVAPGGSALVASLVDARTTLGGADALAAGELAGAARGPDVVTWILLVVLALLALEWVLVRTGRMP